jgi:hypothetical protein
MKQAGAFHQVGFVLSLVTLGLFTMGTKACQEDYELGSQISVTPTATPTETDDGDGLITRTPTATATSAATSTNTPTPTPTETIGTAAELIRAFKAAESKELSPKSTPAAVTLGSPAKANSKDPVTNWLGEIGNAGARETLDSDSDGYLDWFEEEQETDANDELDVPAAPKSKLSARVPLFTEISNSGDDTDGDGLSDTFETKVGTQANNIDSDNDGVVDGKEVELGSDPLISDL